MNNPNSVELAPTPVIYREKIGGQDWQLVEEALDVHKDVILWTENPRLQTHHAQSSVASEEELEAMLQITPGYDTLRKSIDNLGQMEPIYVWRSNDSAGYLVIEGATRVSILRQLDRRYTSGINEGKHRKVKAKVLPPHFGEKERRILLARIHVRGTGIRAWGRYIEAKFIHDTVVDKGGSQALMNVTQMAQHMEKSVSWVQRLRDAYEFAAHFVSHVDSPDAEQLAARYFSVLEEASKAKTIGSQLRDYSNPAFDELRADVFDMVRNEVFKEYRDARFLKELYNDPEKWEQMKSGEKHIASRLAMEVKSNTNSPKAKIALLPQQIRRSIDSGKVDYDEEDVSALQQTIDQISDHLNEGIRPFRVSLKNITRILTEASMADIKALSIDEVSEFNEALAYFKDLLQRHGRGA